MGDDDWRERAAELEKDVLSGFARSQSLSKREQVRTALSNWAAAIPDGLSMIVDVLVLAIGVALLQSGGGAVASILGGVLAALGGIGVLQSVVVRIR